jgi:hypothetical protein
LTTTVSQQSLLPLQSLGCRHSSVSEELQAGEHVTVAPPGSAQQTVPPEHGAFGQSMALPIPPLLEPLLDPLLPPLDPLLPPLDPPLLEPLEPPLLPPLLLPLEPPLLDPPLLPLEPPLLDPLLPPLEPPLLEPLPEPLPLPVPASEPKSVGLAPPQAPQTATDRTSVVACRTVRGRWRMKSPQGGIIPAANR